MTTATIRRKAKQGERVTLVLDNGSAKTLTGTYQGIEIVPSGEEMVVIHNERDDLTYKVMRSLIDSIEAI